MSGPALAGIGRRGKKADLASLSGLVFIIICTLELYSFIVFDYALKETAISLSAGGDRCWRRGGGWGRGLW